MTSHPELALHTPPTRPLPVPSQAAPPARAPDAAPETVSSADGFRLFGEDGFTFWDLVDMVNPLQHLPVIGTIYREITGDELDPGARLVGGTVFGGAIGLGFAAANVMIEAQSGRDLGSHVMAMVTGDGGTGGTGGTGGPGGQPGAAPLIVASDEAGQPLPSRPPLADDVRVPVQLLPPTMAATAAPPVPGATPGRAPQAGILVPAQRPGPEPAAGPAPTVPGGLTPDARAALEAVHQGLVPMTAVPPATPPAQTSMVGTRLSPPALQSLAAAQTGRADLALSPAQKPGAAVATAASAPRQATVTSTHQPPSGSLGPWFAQAMATGLDRYDALQQDGSPQPGNRPDSP